MLKRSSSSSSLRLWTRTQRGGAFFVSDTTEIVFFFESSSFFRGRERRAKERKRCTRLHERERERNDPFEPDDDVNDAKISLTFFLSSSRVSLSKHARLYTLLGPRTRTKKKPILSLVFSQARCCCFFWRHKVEHSPSTSKGSYQKRASRDYAEQILFFFFFVFVFLARKKKSKKTPL